MPPPDEGEPTETLLKSLASENESMAIKYYCRLDTQAVGSVAYQ